VEPIIIRTLRLILRPFREEDAEDVLVFAGDPNYAFFATDQPPMTVEDVRDYLAKAAVTPWSERLRFAIQREGRVIGAIELQPDWPNGTGSLGYGIAPHHQGRGYATEAIRAVIAHAFEVLGLAKVWARADPRNAASVRVLQKAGMKEEGVLRSHVLRRGERADRVYYGILRDEYLKTSTK
jgi:RimJ/RimL family protein N-acetyltransferase